MVLLLATFFLIAGIFCLSLGLGMTVFRPWKYKKLEMALFFGVLLVVLLATLFELTIIGAVIGVQLTILGAGLYYWLFFCDREDIEGLLISKGSLTHRSSTGHVQLSYVEVQRRDGTIVRVYIRTSLFKKAIENSRAVIQIEKGALSSESEMLPWAFNLKHV